MRAQYGEVVDVADWFASFCAVFNPGAAAAPEGEAATGKDSPGPSAVPAGRARAARGRGRKKQIANQVWLCDMPCPALTHTQ